MSMKVYHRPALFDCLYFLQKIQNEGNNYMKETIFMFCNYKIKCFCWDIL